MPTVSGMPSLKTWPLSTNTRSPSLPACANVARMKILLTTFVTSKPAPKPFVVDDPVTALKVSVAARAWNS